jgi:hypothetical protein
MSLTSGFLKDILEHWLQFSELRVHLAAREILLTKISHSHSCWSAPLRWSIQQKTNLVRTMNKTFHENLKWNQRLCQSDLSQHFLTSQGTLFLVLLPPLDNALSHGQSKTIQTLISEAFDIYIMRTRPTEIGNIFQTIMTEINLWNRYKHEHIEPNRDEMVAFVFSS